MINILTSTQHIMHTCKGNRKNQWQYKKISNQRICWSLAENVFGIGGGQYQIENYERNFVGSSDCFCSFIGY